MAKGIIYLMSTAVSGLVKIGKTGTNNYQERMRFLEANGYYNVAGLRRYFATSAKTKISPALVEFMMGHTGPENGSYDGWTEKQLGAEYVKAEPALLVNASADEGRVIGIWDLGVGIWDLGFGIWVLGFGILILDAATRASQNAPIAATTLKPTAIICVFRRP